MYSRVRSLYIVLYIGRTALISVELRRGEKYIPFDA
jgi:hypothetical protein